MFFRSRLCRAVLLAVVALLLVSPSSASAHCPCWEDCSFFVTFYVFCIPAEQGVVGYCHCKERPCMASGSFCSVIVVTP
ncbi:MAG TPA: hypothetical protein VHN15_02910 [Thermoanaerobaculia bacterium]|nr:hypothetical protein [Thermoanaerobaculia bacterium]